MVEGITAYYPRFGFRARERAGLHLPASEDPAWIRRSETLAALAKSMKCPADVALRYLRELPTTWHRADGGPGGRTLAEALFERIDVLGAREATIRLTDAAVAYGFAAVIPERLEVTVGSGRGERDSPSLTHQPPPGLLLINKTPPRPAVEERPA